MKTLKDLIDDFCLCFTDRNHDKDNIVIEPFKTRLDLVCFINDVNRTKKFLLAYEKEHPDVSDTNIHQEYYTQSRHLYIDIKKRAENSLSYTERKQLPKRGCYMYHLIKAVIDKWAKI